MSPTAIRVNKFCWVPIVGVEIHAQINSLSKLFSSAPNTNSSKCALNSNFHLFDVSMPGSLPRLNEYCVEAGVKTALALGLRVNKVSVFDRKHYFYADLPAGYQITQQRMPLAVGGHLKYPIYTSDFLSKAKLRHLKVRFDRLQLEHDSAKTVNVPTSDHAQGGGGGEKVLIDMNRCGAPLMEIVTQPDFQFGYQVASFVEEIVWILKTIGTCDCRFHEGSLRVDASVSVHRPDSIPRHCLDYVDSNKHDATGDEDVDDSNSVDEEVRRSISFRCIVDRRSSTETIATAENASAQPIGGTIVEIKNINSVKFLTEAIDYEILRQIELYEACDDTKSIVENETRAYNSKAERKTVGMRDKTKVHDYRFLPETNLPPLVLKCTPGDESVKSHLVISEIHKSLPQLPQQIRAKIAENYNLTSHSFGTLLEFELLDFFNHVTSHSRPVKIKDADTLLSLVLYTSLRKARPQIKVESLFEISDQIAHLSNLKDETFLDSSHILKAVQLLLNSDVDFKHKTRDLGNLVNWLIEKKLHITYEKDETTRLFDSFCLTNHERFKSVAEEFEQGMTIDSYALDTCPKFHKLQNKFGRATKFQHDSDFTFQLFLQKLNEFISSKY